MAHSKSHIRNFSIIAHIDHGKSTVADRLLLHTHTIDERNFHEQMLDDMDLERERGITIKSHPVRMMYYRTGEPDPYQLNLIDTPGHVDFSYEVSRSLAACDGAVLIVDAGQGVQAQTVANVNLAMQQDLNIIPVINKIDLPGANVEMCLTQLEEMLALPVEEALLVSAKEDKGTEELLEAIVERTPPPQETEEQPTRALVFDSLYNSYRGVISYVRVFNGSMRTGKEVALYNNNVSTYVKEAGVFSPNMTTTDSLEEGEVGYIITAIKDPKDVPVGDTVTDVAKPCIQPLPGFKEVQPAVFSGIYPAESSDYETLSYSISRLRLNDAAFVSQSEHSAALGAGFRCGFLGLLHMEIIQERLKREYEMNIILTYPSVIYQVYTKDKNVHRIENPVHMPDPGEIERIEEPIIDAQLIVPADYMGSVMNLIFEKRGECRETETADKEHVIIWAKLPLQEVITEFYDRLKSITRGYGSFDYKHTGYWPADLVKLEMMVNGDPIDAFACIVHRSRAESRGRDIAERLKEVIPRQMFTIALQATVSGKVVAREDIKALRKNVTAKCYGGDVTRKRKLLEKQKEGKRRMKQVGKVDIPQEAFVNVLKSRE